jgi:hypothetical protein
MYLTLNFYQDNIYILINNHNTKLIKNNFLYNLTDKYSKIIATLSNIKQIDTIKIHEDNKLPITINTNWSLSRETNIKKILIPPRNHINLIDPHIDLNSINCICQDTTSIKILPQIKIILNDDTEFILNKWTGNNQTWISNSYNKQYIAYGFLYIFTSDINEFNDLDIISVYHHNMINDEFNRINCTNLKMNFDNYDILHYPLNQIIDNIKIETIYE